ncbi:hypothetical protein Tco_0436122 [Tanacetum coccineum]
MLPLDLTTFKKVKEPKHSTDASIKLIGSSKPQLSITQAQPITIINPEPIIPQREGKGIATDDQVEDQRKPVVNYLTAEQLQAHILKPEAITDIKIHPKTKPEEIIPTKKNVVVKDLMNYLAKRYERIRKIPEELGIKSALPAPVHASEQASSKFSRKKRKHMELEPEVKLPGLEWNRTLPKNVPFVNNMVIKEPEYEILFADEFGDQAFQRWSDIDKVGMKALVSYLVAASMVNSPENARFDINLRKLIAKHLDQEKLKSKKVKLEALRYKMN